MKIPSISDQSATTPASMQITLVVASCISCSSSSRRRTTVASCFNLNLKKDEWSYNALDWHYAMWIFVVPSVALVSDFWDTLSAAAWHGLQHMKKLSQAQLQALDQSAVKVIAECIDNCHSCTMGGPIENELKSCVFVTASDLVWTQHQCEEDSVVNGAI